MRFPSLLPVRRLTVLAGAVLALVGCASRAPTGQAMPDPAPAPAPAPSVAEPNATPPVTPASAEQRFAEWVARFRESARAAGIDEATLSAAFDTVRLRPRAVEADRSQPEFTRTLWDYLDAAVSPQRVDAVRQLRDHLAEAGVLAADDFHVGHAKLFERHDQGGRLESLGHDKAPDGKKMGRYTAGARPVMGLTLCVSL